MKKPIRVIGLIVLIGVILAGSGRFNNGQPKQAGKIYMAACSESIHDMTVKSRSILEETLYSPEPEKEKDEDTFDTMLEWFQDCYQEREYWDSVCYQMAMPCHFFINVYPANDPLNCYEYRNIDENDEILWDEDGRTNTEPGYIADVVVDTYIREYGGEDTQYHIIDTGIVEQGWKEPTVWPGYFMEIRNDDVTLNVLWDGALYGTAVSVYIEDYDGAEVQYKRIIEYAYHMEEEKFYDYFREHWKDAYCMFIDPEPGQKEYHYRNVDPTDAALGEGELIYDAFAYAIADRVIDKYIRDWDGSDIVYDVKMINKIKDKEKDVYHYILSVVDQGEEILQIEYTEKEWFVMVNICNQ
ncbi:MAG: hypothetical protein NC118_03635 [Eubacterium sp.]|nr:hypothetical protein [Eubacterium sp.]